MKLEEINNLAPTFVVRQAMAAAKPLGYLYTNRSTRVDAPHMRHVGMGLGFEPSETEVLAKFLKLMEQAGYPDYPARVCYPPDNGDVMDRGAQWQSYLRAPAILLE